jgi:cytochrome c peroxidase
MKLQVLIGAAALLFLAASAPNLKPIPKKAKKISKIELGKQLFFDPILSADSSVSCASCHKPEFYFADNVSFSVGIGGKLTKRNTPSVLNMASRDLMFWDGRAQSLEDQVLFPIRDHNEMNMPIHDAIGKLKKSKKYQKWFMEVFGKKPDEKLLSQAVASFEATLETSNSKFDRANKGEIKLTKDELAGKNLFVGKGKCFDCHFSPDFTGDEFKNIGLYDGKKWNDKGRFEVTKDSSDLGKFKVPGLRNVSKTAPYMHNGSFKTLREVIDFYAKPSNFVPDAIGTDSTIVKGLDLSELEKNQLEAFMNALTDEAIIDRFKNKK